MEEKTEKKIETQGKNTESKRSQTNSEATKENRKVENGEARSTDRVSLNAESYSRTEHWLSQSEKRHKGIRFTRNDLVNFILLQHAPTLSEEELSVIGQVHFDDVRFYAWAVKTVREARTRGESLTVAALEKQYKVPR